MDKITVKQEFINKAKENGYDTDYVDGIPYILNVSYETADKFVKQIGYMGSYGVKTKKEDEINE